MNREETKEILKAVQGYYPTFVPADMAATLDLWTMAFDEYNYRDVSIALLSFVKTDDKGYAPVPGQLIALIHKTNEPEPMGETEAFDKVMKAIERSAWHSQEEFDKLDPILQKIVGNPHQLQDWSALSIDEITMNIRPMIIRDYKVAVERQNEYARLPEEVRARIDAVNKKPYEGRLLGEPDSGRITTPTDKPR